MRGDPSCAVKAISALPAIVAIGKLTHVLLEMLPGNAMESPINRLLQLSGGRKGNLGVIVALALRLRLRDWAMRGLSGLDFRGDSRMK